MTTSFEFKPRKVRIGIYEVCLSMSKGGSYGVRTFVGDALWREASNDFTDPEQATNWFNRLVRGLRVIQELNVKVKVEDIERETRLKEST